MILYVGHTKSSQIDLNNDGINDTIKLKNHTISIEINNEIIWTSDHDWRVTDYITGDINHDGKEELLILLWKKGSYGEHLPIWEKENDNKKSQHIFIYEWQDSSINSIWMSSKLRPEIKRWEMLEDNQIHIITRKNEDTIWRWNYFGLERCQ